MIHHLLEGVPSVLQPGGKSEEIKHSKGSNNGCFWNLLGGHRDLVVALLEIQPTENS